MNLLWVVLALTQHWYYVLPVYFFVNAADSITIHFFDIVHSICELPMPSSTYICRTITSLSKDPSPYAVAVTSGFNSLGDLAFDAAGSSIAGGSKGHHSMSVDDTVFLIRSNRMQCHEQLVEELDRMKEEFFEVSDRLIELRVQAFSAIDL